MDPVRELEKLLLVHICALFVHLAVVQLHHCVHILVVHLERQETHLEKLLVGVLSNAHRRSLKAPLRGTDVSRGLRYLALCPSLDQSSVKKAVFG